MEAIVLAGGFGSRLQPVIRDLPKPMADIGGRPFLSYVMDYLSMSGVQRALLSVGYKYHYITEYFGMRHKNMTISYVIEGEPLGTGGAVREALHAAEGEDVTIVNGDTFFDVELSEMIAFHAECAPDITIAVKPMHDFDRYGAVALQDARVIDFEEKSFKSFGFINGGLYLANRKKILDRLRHFGKAFSFETDFLQKQIDTLTCCAFVSDGYFIDIGIPADYKKAQEELHRIVEGPRI